MPKHKKLNKATKERGEEHKKPGDTKYEQDDAGIKNQNQEGAKQLKSNKVDEEHGKNRNAGKEPASTAQHPKLGEMPTNSHSFDLANHMVRKKQG